MVEYIDFRPEAQKSAKKEPKVIFTKREVIDIIKSWVVLSLVFTLANVGLNFSSVFLYVFLASALTVGVGFILHELGHKIVAQKFGKRAEFVAFNQMLFMALIFGLMGFVFFAPGGVFIYGYGIDKKKNGIISTFGPLVNVVLALVFMPFYLMNPTNIFLDFGFKVNAWLALFNMIPFGNFDGIKIFRWNKLVYFALVISSGFMVFFV